VFHRLAAETGKARLHADRTVVRLKDGTICCWPELAARSLDRDGMSIKSTSCPDSDISANRRRSSVNFKEERHFSPKNRPMYEQEIGLL